MATRYFGQPIKRNEDPRLLRGRGLYVDDVQLPGMLHMALVRSPYARARIRRIDTSKALAAPGVVAVITHADLPANLQGPLPPLIPHPTLKHHKTQFALAPGQVRHAGEAVAAVVAESRYAAEDAAELVEVEYEPLPAVVDMEKALDPGSPLVHEDIGTNVAAHYTQVVGDVEKAFAEADLVFEEVFRPDRGQAQPMETRGVVAVYDRNLETLTIWDSTQAPIRIRSGLAELYGMRANQVRVIAPNVGGGFGPKIMMFYPEEVLVPWLAMKLGRPVKYIEDRREHFFATNQERDQVHRVQVAVRKDGTILGIKDVFLYDTGAYIPYGLIIPIVASCTLPGPYKIPNYHAEFKAVFTNKTICSPYRGAGRPHGVFVMERIINRIAEELGIDRVEVRRRNLIQPDEFPYDVGLIYQDNAPLRYDSGNYPGLLDKLLKLIEYDQWPARKEQYRKEGRYVGLGLALYVEGTGVGPYEGARVHVEPSGKVWVATGVGTQGQSHQTTFAQIVAEELGVRVEDVEVVTGDTGAFHWGTGTFASRAAVVAGNAVALAARDVKAKALEVAANLLEASVEDLELADGQVRVKGAPQRAVSLGQVAVAANPLRGTIPPGQEPGLEAARYFNPPQSAFSAGGHAAIIEVDPATGMIKILKYAVVHDCGRLINPMVVEGQIHGGVAQGIGGSFYERLVFDENGQLLTTTFMDFLIPTAMEVPDIAIDHQETPSPLNPLGVKGAGEAGVIPVPALFVDAIEDAFSGYGLRFREVPLDPNRLRQALAEAGVPGAGSTAA
ncbi:MAG: xanthine dehydrogenase family protein molybdopterin-binding subunit [Thermaerobacter sp.]